MNQVQKMTLQLVTVMASLLSCALCFPSGAPQFACKSLRPQHLGAPLTQQQELSPYSIAAHTVALAPGASTTVNVTSRSTAKEDGFYGFMCAVSLLDDNQHKTLGTMVALQPDISQTRDCSHSTPATAITHRSSDPKWGVDFSWVAPDDAIPGTQYKLRCVVVQTIRKCWNDFQINITISSPPNNTQSQSRQDQTTGSASDNDVNNNNSNTSNNRVVIENAGRGSNDAATLNKCASDMLLLSLAILWNAGIQL